MTSRPQVLTWQLSGVRHGDCSCVTPIPGVLMGSVVKAISTWTLVREVAERSGHMAMRCCHATSMHGLWPIAIAMFTMNTGCGEPRCGFRVWGGGEFTISLAGPVTGTVTRSGLTTSELEQWLGGDAFTWMDPTTQYAQWGRTGGLYGEPIGTSDLEGFSGGVLLDTPLMGCPGSTFLGVFAGNDGWARITVVDAEGLFLYQNSSMEFDYQGSRDGHASWTSTVDNAGEGSCLAEAGPVEVDVRWRMSKDVSVKEVRRGCNALF